MPDPLPDWPAGTVCVLATTGDDGPHAIPVSTALRVADDRIVLALAGTRGTLERLRADPRVALSVMAGPDLAFTVHGRARVVAEQLPGAEGVSGVEIAVDMTSRHERPAFAIDAGVAWRWLAPEAQERDAAVRAALSAL
jgi:Pyridoxamine 5'-phosphate oxidase